MVKRGIKLGKPLLVRNKHFLKFFSSLSPVKRKKLISTLATSQVNTVSEICQNFLKRKLPCTPAALKKLRPLRPTIYGLCSRRTPLYEKKRLMKSSRGGALLSVLLPLAVTAVSSLISKFASK